MEYEVIQHAEEVYSFAIDTAAGRCGDKLANKINEKMRDGWRLQGGVSIHCQRDDDGDTVVIYAQAMIRESINE
jgi:hypothetical protein